MLQKRFVYAAVAFCFLTLTSCKKLIESLFPGETITLPAYNVTVPIIPFADSTQEVQAGSFTTYINTDSIIKAQTNGEFGIKDVSNVTVTQVALSLSNADAYNNLSAFKNFIVSISSNTNSTVENMFSINIPAGTGASYTAAPSNPANIAGYLQGTAIDNTVYGAARSTTTKQLYLSAVITLYAK